MDASVRVLSCPQCGASLTPPSRFARETTCAFCGSKVALDPSVVSVARFREAHARWTAPAAQGFDRWVTIEGTSWAPLRVLGRGESSDVVLVKRTRSPSEHAVLAILREGADPARFEAKWQLLRRIDDGGPLARLLPQPFLRGLVSEGAPARPAMLLRWVSGFEHNLDDVRRAYPRGVSGEIATWLWRRTLELLAHLHKRGIAHGAVLPPHLLAHGSEHGVRLVGFGRAEALGAPLAPEHAPLHPPELPRRAVLTPALDVQMSARAIAGVLGGDAATGEVPADVPRPLAELVEGVARRGSDDAWALREELGLVARRVFGAPSFHPLGMPDPTGRPG